MRIYKQLLLTAYYYGTLPCRGWVNARAAKAGQAPILVLFYHRIADEQANAWTTTNDQFARQIGWLAKRFDLVSLQEAQQRICSGWNNRPALSITFDDGYAENCLHALPLLVKQRIPVTYFVSTRNVLEGVPFPHDVARGKPLPRDIWGTRSSMTSTRGFCGLDRAWSRWSGDGSQWLRRVSACLATNVLRLRTCKSMARCALLELPNS